MSTTDTDRHINSYIHDILNFLKSHNGPVSFTDIYKKLRIDVHNNYRLFRALQTNEKISITNNFIQYMYTYNIKHKEDLLSILSKNKEGIELAKLKDNQRDISEILEECKKDMQCIVLKDNDGSEVVFYNDMVIDQVDTDLINLWRSVRIPGYQDLLRELNVAGIKSDKNESVKRKAITKKTKTKKYRRNIKLTNTHVKGLDLSGMDEN
ncbi:hypothetical protein P3W45_001709 [Vairimorpha bombi]|jgi:transcription initiation factor TFIIE subunit beta